MFVSARAIRHARKKAVVKPAMTLAMPQPKADVLARRAAIATDLRAIVPGEGVVVDPARCGLRDRRADRLPPDADAGRAAGDGRAGQPRPALLPRERHPRGAARLRHVALRRRAAARRRRAARHVEVQQDPRHRLRQPRASSCSRASPISASPTRSSHRGFYYAPDPSSQIACSIGGNVAENSGGVHCLKYGLTANNVLGIEMVLITGEVIRLGGKHLDAEGYDLLGLMTGSEGLLGVVTEVTVRILQIAGDGARRARRLSVERGRRPLRRRHHRRRHHPGRHGDDGPAGDPRGGGFRPCRLSARRRGAADRRARRAAARGRRIC